MKRTALAILAALSLSTWAQAQQPVVVEALDGIDPVLLVQGKEISGKPEFKVVRGRFEYLFASAATKATFEGNPAQYEIQLNGLCARMGKATGGRPADYLVHDGKIYIFGSDDCHRLFAADPKKYLAAPAPPIDGSVTATAQGRALIDRVMAAIGGPAKVDAVSTYVETASQIQKRASGIVPVTTRTTWRFPGDVRMERTITVEDRPMSSATLMTSAGLWFISQGRAFPIIEAGRPSLQLDYGRQIIPLLRGRHDRGFKATSLGRRSVEGAQSDLVRIVNGGVDVTLGIDPSSGRVQTISFADRNIDGEVGEYTIVYSDYRDVAGLTLPFAERALFNGVADQFLSRRLEAVAINAPVDDALFRPGAPGGQ